MGKQEFQSIQVLRLLVEATSSRKTSSNRNFICKNSYKRNSFLQWAEKRVMFSVSVCMPMRGVGKVMENPVTSQDMVIASGVRETASEEGPVLLNIQHEISFTPHPVGFRL